MKRRDFMKAAGTIIGGIALAAPSLIPKPSRITPGVPINGVALIPYLPCGDIGIIYGSTGSGKSQLVYKMWDRNADSHMIDLQVNPTMRYFKNLQTILDDYPRKNIYIDNLNLLSFEPTGNPLNTQMHYYRRIVMNKLTEIAREQNCRMWVTIQSPRVHGNYADFGHTELQNASIAMRVINDDGDITAAVVKNRYGNTETMHFGRSLCS